jgi:hypothetical protein
MKVFLSCVSSEFRSYRLNLANQLGALKGQPYEVKVQEDSEQGSGSQDSWDSDGGRVDVCGGAE